MNPLKREIQSTAMLRKNAVEGVKIPEKKKVRFLHVADVHLGSLRGMHERVLEIPMHILKMVVEFAIKYCVDFVVIAGDLFHSHVTSIDILKDVQATLVDAKEHGIRMYAIYGSHDASPTHSSYVDVLASAKLLTQVEVMEQDNDGKLTLKPVMDSSGINLVGIHGRTRGIDALIYENLNFEALAKIPKPRIFLLHNAIAEYRPEFLKETQDSIPLSLIPADFDYYACGHVHQRIEPFEERGGIFAYPGQLFAATSRDLEEITSCLPGFYLVDVDEHGISRDSIMFVDIYSLAALTGNKYVIPDVVFIKLEFGVTTPEEMNNEIEEKLGEIKREEIEGKIVLLKVSGTLKGRKRTEVKWEQFYALIKEMGALDVYIGREGVYVVESEHDTVVHGETREEIEEKTIEECFARFEGALGGREGAQRAKEILQIFASMEQQEGENKDTYETRMYSLVKAHLKLEEER